MTWVVWRQHRVELVALLVGAALVVAALVVGAEIALRTRQELGVDSCVPLPNTNANCVNAAVEAGRRVQVLRFLLPILFFLPALAGSFLGGPLFARELERGTHRFVWTQTISRLRWSAAHLGTILAAAAAAATAVALTGGRATTINGGAPDAYAAFDLEGPAFVSHAVFAIACAALVGTLSRRILTGMLGGLVLYGAIQLGVLFWARPSYEPPVTVLYAPGQPATAMSVPSGAWQIGNDYVDRAGTLVPWERVSGLYEASGHFNSLDYLAEHGVYQRVRYQPADRYWRFQWTEGALFLALSAAAGAATLSLLVRRDA